MMNPTPACLSRHPESHLFRTFLYKTMDHPRLNRYLVWILVLAIVSAGGISMIIINYYTVSEEMEIYGGATVESKAGDPGVINIT
jgi:hypothetical protein